MNWINVVDGLATFAQFLIPAGLIAWADRQREAR